MIPEKCEAKALVICSGDEKGASAGQGLLLRLHLWSVLRYLVSAFAMAYGKPHKTSTLRGSPKIRTRDLETGSQKRGAPSQQPRTELPTPQEFLLK
ncbi:hypothetical protein Trydic_g16685 [Trypoxylus dichotomus]